MSMCIGSFSLHSKWIGLSKRDPNLSVLLRDVESDRLIGNWDKSEAFWLGKDLSENLRKLPGNFKFEI